MERFYSLIVFSDSLNEKEITLPAERYIVHLHPDATKKHDSHNESINLDIHMPDASLEYIKFSLSENHYTVSYKTDDNILITEEINYNTPFIYEKKPLFSIKKTDEDWHKTILKIRQKHLTNKEKKSGLHLKKTLPIMISLLITLIVFWLYDKTMNENHNKDDVKTIINTFIRHSGYIQENNHFLFIINHDSDIPDDVHLKLKPYVISALNADLLKRDSNDIINIKKNDELIDIIYISTKKNLATNGMTMIPEIFENRLRISQFSFDDIITLINESVCNNFTSYSIIRNNKKIIVSSEQESNDHIKKCINEINKSIFHNSNDSLVSYKQIKKSISSPGIYGKQPYRILPGDHIDFTPHNK